MIMESFAGIVILIASVGLSIFLGEKLKVNSGIIATVFAMFIGVFLYGNTASGVLGSFKGWYLITIALITMFFGFHSANGTMKVAAQKISYKMRNVKWAVPLVSIFICWIVVGMGGDAFLSPFMAPIIYTFIMNAGLEPVLASVITLFACGIGSQSPWGANWTTMEACFEGFVEGYGHQLEVGYYWFSVLICFVMVFLCYFYYKIKNGKNAAVSIHREIEKPEDFTPEQRKSLILMIVFALLIIIPSGLSAIVPCDFTAKLVKYLDLRIVCGVGIILSSALKLADPADVFKNRIPWGVIITITGMMLLISVASPGVVTYVQTAMTGATISPTIVKIVFYIVGISLSFVGTGIGTVFPLTGALSLPVGLALGISPWRLMFASEMGAIVTALSPYSTGGSFALMGCPDEIKDDTTKKQLIWTGISAVVGLVICMTFGDVLCGIVE